MKLIYIANIRLPTEKAHGIQIMKMCEALSNQDLDVELLVPRRINDLLEDPFDFYQVKRIFKITRILCFDLVSFEKWRIGFFVSTLSFLFFTKIYLFFREYDILYSRELLTGLFFRNYFFELHNFLQKPGRFYKFLIFKPRTIFALTGFLMDNLKKTGIADKKIMILPDAVDLAEFSPSLDREGARKKLNLPLDKKIIIYTGSFLFYKWKGIGSLLDAGKLLKDDFLFVLVGGHPWEIRKLKERPIPLNVLLVSYQKHEIIPYYLKAADIFVIPNEKGDAISEKYTSPLKLFEYMASRRPIISSDLPSLREILTEKEALFFEAGNPADLVRAIKKIFEDKDLSEKLSYNAYQKVKDYTWEKRAKKIIFETSDKKLY